MSLNISIHGANIEFDKDSEMPLTNTIDASGNEIFNLLIKLLSSEESVNKLKTEIKISEKSIEFVRLMVNSGPEVFKTIERDIDEILVDGVLDIADLPSLVLLVKDVLNLKLDTIKLGIKNLTVQDSIKFIKDLLLILVEEEYILVTDKETVKKLIDACIELLGSTINLNATTVSFLSSVFGLSCCKK